MTLYSSTEAILDTRLNVNWKSSAPAVLKLVEKDGWTTVIGRSEGMPTLTAECLGVARTLEVKVCEEPQIQWF